MESGGPIQLEQPNPPGYTLCEKLGSGTYATVYRAISLGPGPSGVRETVAVKCIDKRRATSTKIASNNLVNEIAILKKLKHRHIVQLKDFHWDRYYIYLIMEYCSGGDLSRFIKQQRRLPESVAKKFLVQLASAVKYCRSHNVSHMDLKPQNILLTSKTKPILKVADFGFAQYLREEIDVATSYRGSPLYMAPEILNSRQYDASVDLWSIGVILYECVFGRAPFSSTTMQELIAQVTSTTPVAIPNDGTISDECRDLLSGLLCRNPGRRLTFDEFFNHPFVDLANSPSEKSLPDANRLLTDAARLERTGDLLNSLKHYVNGIECLLMALQYTDDENERQQLRRRIKDQCSKAESVKRRLRPNPRQPRRSGGASSSDKSSSDISTDSVSSSPGQTPRAYTPDSNMALARPNSASEMENLEQMWSDVPQVHAAFTVIWSAENLEAEDKWAQALDKYQLAIQSMLQLLQSEPTTSDRKALLHRRVAKWLDRAEQIQGYVEAMKMNLSMMDERGDTAAGSFEDLTPLKAPSSTSTPELPHNNHWSATGQQCRFM